MDYRGKDVFCHLKSCDLTNERLGLCPFDPDLIHWIKSETGLTPSGRLSDRL